MYIKTTKSIQYQSTNTHLQSIINDKINSRPSKSNHLINNIIKNDMVRIERDQVQEIFKIIQNYQCKKQKGYFNYEGWVEINQEMFAYVSLSIIIQLWKILRVINYGDVLIPTGLVYDIIYHFRYETKNGWSLESINNKNGRSLRLILNNFLQKNRRNDSIKSFRQLSNYLEIEEIEKAFKKQDVILHKNKKENKQNNNDIFQRLHHQNSKKKITLNQMQYHSILKQIKQCSFAPHIHSYILMPQYHKNRQKCDKNISQKGEIVKEFQQFKQFKSKPVDQKIYECDLLNIPGANQHILRNQSCQAERQRLKRYMDRPTTLKKKV